jgi:hypothetical protein
MLWKSPTAVLPDVLTALREIAGSPPAEEDLANTLLNFIVKNIDHFLPDERLKAALVFRP